MKNRDRLHRLILGALFLALSCVLPLFTGQIPKLGEALCPMHLPVLLCGFLCGPLWGLCVGLAAPLLRSFTFGMPPLFPTAVAMCFELGTYGLLSGLFYRILPREKGSVLLSLVLAMLGGRVIWGLARLAAVGFRADAFGFGAFLAGGFVTALPGIVLQLLVVPSLVVFWEKQQG